MKNQFRFLAVTIGFTLLTFSIQAQNKETNLKFGKYGCTATKYINGFYQYSPKGAFTINKNGSYTYLGFEKPSTGKFSVDEKGTFNLKVVILTVVKQKKLTHLTDSF